MIIRSTTYVTFIHTLVQTHARLRRKPHLSHPLPRTLCEFLGRFLEQQQVCSKCVHLRSFVVSPIMRQCINHVTTLKKFSLTPVLNPSHSLTAQLYSKCVRVSFLAKRHCAHEATATNRKRKRSGSFQPPPPLASIFCVKCPSTPYEVLKIKIVINIIKTVRSLVILSNENKNKPTCSRLLTL